MEQKKEAVYLINDERYLHLRENGAGVGFATYNKVTGEPLESGQISEKNLPPDGRNTIPAARNWYLFELSDDDRKAIQQESVKILENIPQAGIGRRRIWEPETLPKDIRLINSHYDDLYRIPDGGVIQVDYPDGRSFTARVEHLDDYHFDMGGLGNVFHICQFAEQMERCHNTVLPLTPPLPEKCFTVQPSSGELIAIERYKPGYQVSPMAYFKGKTPQQTADVLNGDMGVTRAQAAAMDSTPVSKCPSRTRKPSRDMPVSTLMWTFSVPPLSTAAALYASALALADTA